MTRTPGAWFTCGVAAMVLAACSADVSGPGEVVTDDLRIALVVAPTAIERQEALTATLSLENRTTAPLELTSSCTALALIRTIRGGQPVDLEGSAGGCFTAITPFELGAGETLTRTYEIRAVRRDGEPVDRGTYVLQVDFMVPGLPTVEAVFEVS